MPNFIDLTGKTYGRLLVIKRAENRRTSGGRSQVQFLCQCQCGNKVIVKSQHLMSGNTKSCGCLNIDTVIKRSTTHGLYYTRLHNIWCGMKQRCYYRGSKQFKYYGERGISICDEWRNDFKTFYDWAINYGYSDSLTIDRINNDGNYEPCNCRWATNEEQQKNKRQRKPKDMKNAI